MRLAGHIARKRAKRKDYKLLAEKSEGKRPIGRKRRTWMNNNIYLGEKVWFVMDGIDLAPDRKSWREGSCECCNEPSD
jgi:hypothetical protein